MIPSYNSKTEMLWSYVQICAVAERRRMDFDIPAPLPCVCSHKRGVDAGRSAIYWGQRWFAARGFEADAENWMLDPFIAEWILLLLRIRSVITYVWTHVMICVEANFPPTSACIRSAHVWTYLYKSLVCLNNRSLNTRYALHIFYEPRDPTSMQFKEKSTDLIFIITIRGTTDIVAMIVLVFPFIHDEGAVAGIVNEFHGVWDNFLSIVHISRLMSITHVSHELSEATLWGIFHDLMQFGDFGVLSTTTISDKRKTAWFFRVSCHWEGGSGFVWHDVISDVLLHECSHVFELVFSVGKEGWHFFEIVTQMIWHLNIDIQKSKKVSSNMASRMVDFLVTQQCLRYKGGWCCRANSLSLGSDLCFDLNSCSHMIFTG